MAAKMGFKPQRLRTRIIRYVLAAVAATTGFWLVDYTSGVHDSAWTLLRFMAILLLIAAPISEWIYRRQARAAARRNDQPN